MIDFAGIQKQVENFVLPYLCCAVQPDKGYMDEVSGARKYAFGDDGVNMRMPMNKVPECLNGADHRGNATVAVYFKSENITDRFISCPTEFSQQLSIIAEINP